MTVGVGGKLTDVWRFVAEGDKMVSEVTVLIDDNRPKDEEIFRRDGFRCVYCGFDGREFEGWMFLEVDHFQPKSADGKDSSDNLVTACAICNRMKAANVWSSLEEARRNLSQWRSQMRKFWEEEVKPLRKVP